MLRRYVDEFLQEWKARPDHKPLLLMGARQIGKTTSIKAFGRSYRSVVYIDFRLEPIFQRIFDRGFSVDSIIGEISLLRPNERFIPGDTLIVFDEIQAYPDAMTSFKPFALDGRFDLIASGSLLGVFHHRISSIPVGFKEEFRMYPLDFGEYLYAKGYSDEFVNGLKDYLIQGKPLEKSLFDTLQSLYREFVFVGGLPEAVQSFLSSGNYGDAFAVQSRIYRDYEDDVTKYCDTLSVMRVLRFYRHIASQLSFHNHKFQYTRMGHGSRAKDYLGVEDWLKNAGIINIAYALENLSLPLSVNEDGSSFRVYYADHSLFLASLDEEAKKDLIQNENYEIYSGALYESLVSEDLEKLGLPLYYFQNDAGVELDFVLRIKNEVVPLEVKRSRGRARSLNSVLRDRTLGIAHAIKLAGQNIGFADGVLTMPYFLAFHLRSLIDGNRLFSW